MKIVIRKYQPSDAKILAQLFYDTVHLVNCRNYSKEQLNVWASKNIDFNKWCKSFNDHYCLVATINNVIVGFGDIDKNGYLDRLYVHHKYQNIKVATTLCNQLEAFATSKIITHASITAKPFFEKRGYTVVKKQEVIRENISLTNYIMEKILKK